MSLKDLWKAGKLENERRYYCRLKYCGNTIVTYKGEYLMHDRFDSIKRDDELEILDIVPTYEELQKLESDRLAKIEGKEIIAELTETNDSLSRQVKHLLDLQANQDKDVESLRELLHSLKCCLTSQNIEPQIKVEKTLGKIEEFLINEK